MIDLDAIQARIDAATDESGTWGIELVSGGEISISTLGDGPTPGRAAVIFLRHAREDVPDLVAEVRLLREVAAKATAYRVAQGPFGRAHAQEQLEQALAAYDKVTGEGS
jgi:hypothetical protein